MLCDTKYFTLNNADKSLDVHGAELLISVFSINESDDASVYSFTASFSMRLTKCVSVQQYASMHMHLGDAVDALCKSASSTCS